MQRSTVWMAIAAAMVGGYPTYAQGIEADTTGEDNFVDADYYGVSFVSGTGFIESVTIDISADADAFFDFDGSFSYAFETAPVLDLDSLVGLAEDDITFIFDEPHSTFVTVQFAPGSFEAGDSMRFAADTDLLISDPAPGSVFGLAGAIFSVTLEDGPTSLAPYQVTTTTQSVATPTFGGCLTIIEQEVVCSSDGSTFTYSAGGFNGCTGGTTQVTFTGSAGAVGEQVCFSVIVQDNGICCTTELCVTVPDCSQPASAGDVNGDGLTGADDLLELLAAWGACGECDACPSDLNGDCSVDAIDLLGLLADWS